MASRIVAACFFRLASPVLLTLVPGIARADLMCPAAPGGNVYAFVCASSSFSADGKLLTLDSSGRVVESSTGLSGIITAPLQSSTPAAAYLNGELARSGTGNGISSSLSDNGSSRSGGASVESGSGSVGDVKYGSFTVLPFANGSAAVSSERLAGNIVVPNLHAAASGSATSPSTFYAQSAGSASFSDVLSVTQAQITTLRQTYPGGELVYVRFSYNVDGTVTVGPTTSNLGPTSATATASFIIEANSSATFVPEEDYPETDGDTATATSGRTTAGDLSGGAKFSIYGAIEPNSPLVLSVSLTTGGTATGSYNGAGSYDANFANTARFLGVDFFADSNFSIALPALQLGSAFGFSYFPTGTSLSDPTAVGPVSTVPEPGTALLVASGLSLSGFLGSTIAGGRRRRRGR